MNRTILRRDDAGPRRMGKERNRRGRFDEDQLPELAKLLDGLRNDIGDALDDWPARATLDARERERHEEWGTGRGGDAPRRDERRALRCAIAEKDCRRQSIAQQRRD